MVKGRQKNYSPSMGLWSATSIGVGAMIGAGLFALIGIAVDIAGNLAYLAFIFAGVVALFTSYSVSKLAVQFPNKGGPVEYINRGYKNTVLAGTLILSMYMGYIIVTSLYARAFGEYSTALIGLEDTAIWKNVFASTIIIIFILINFVGARAVGASELLIVGIKVFVLVLFGIVGFFTMRFNNFLINNDIQAGSILLASGVVFMSYEGFGLVANTAEDIKEPYKNLPKALFLSVIIVMVIYAMVTITVIGNLSIQGILDAKEYALAEAAKPIMGEFGFTVMGIAALFSTSSAINATIYGPVYMLKETANAGQLFQLVRHTFLGHNSGAALFISGLIILVISNSLPLELIAETGSLIFLGIYTAVNVANFRLRKQTNSNIMLVLLGILSTTLSFIALLYFQILNNSISTYIFLSIGFICFMYQLLYQKYQQPKPTGKRQNI